ncbi:MAG: NosD domain-containing protein [Planctomycetota bacterium]|jgi:parallel beta-helix repeat protein
MIRSRVLVLSIAALMLWTAGAEAQTFETDLSVPFDVWVDDDYGPSTPGWQYTHFNVIKDALDAVAYHGNVHALAGTYMESFSMNKPVKLIGEDKDTTVIDGGEAGHVVRLMADGIFLKGFTLQNSKFKYQYAGVQAVSFHNTIEDCRLTDNFYGISLKASSFNEIHDCLIENNNAGIEIFPDSDENLVQGCVIDSHTMSDGIHIVECTDCTFRNNMITNNKFGMRVGECDRIYIENNNINSNEEDGIILTESTACEVRQNDIASNSDYAIATYKLTGGVIEENQIHSDIARGVSLNLSSSLFITFNDFVGCGITMGNDPFDNVIIDNTVNGKPLVYLNGQQGLLVDDAGQVILHDCGNITVQNVDVSFSDTGVGIFFSNNCLVQNSTMNGCNTGILLFYSPGCEAASNTIMDCTRGIEMWVSANCIIRDNLVSHCYHSLECNHGCDGMQVLDNVVEYATSFAVQAGADSCLFSGNTLQYNEEGLWTKGFDLTITANTFQENIDYGILLFTGVNTTVTDNTFIDDGISNQQSEGHTITGNTVNGRPLVYLYGASDMDILDAGQVILVNCDDIRVIGQDLSYTCMGVQMDHSTNCLISGCDLSHSHYDGITLFYDSDSNIISNNVFDGCQGNGIQIYQSTHNKIKDCVIANTKWDGIWIWDYSSHTTIEDNIIVSTGGDGINSSLSNYQVIQRNQIVHNEDTGINMNNNCTYCTVGNNTVAANHTGIDSDADNIIFHNNLINNTHNASSYGGTWYNVGMKEGNYWSDYLGQDLNGDGIGDTPHPIPGSGSVEDPFPLMTPHGGGALFADNYLLSLGSGGTINFSLHGGKEYADRDYILLGGLSGTQPGTPLPGGLVILPLNWDFFTDFVMANINTYPFQDFMGTLDGNGDGAAQLNMSDLLPGRSLGSVFFAYALRNPYDYVSVPMGLTLLD